MTRRTPAGLGQRGFAKLFSVSAAIGIHHKSGQTWTTLLRRCVHIEGNFDGTWLPRSSPIWHREWFKPEQYKRLGEATKARWSRSKERHRWRAEQLQDFLLFYRYRQYRTAGRREARCLQFRDVSIVDDDDLALGIAVREGVVSSGQVIEVKLEGKGNQGNSWHGETGLNRLGNPIQNSVYSKPE